MEIKYINGNLAVDIPLGGSSCLLFPSPNGILNVGICGGSEENWRTLRNPQSKDEDQQQTQPSCDACLAIEPRPQ